MAVQGAGSTTDKLVEQYLGKSEQFVKDADRKQQAALAKSAQQAGVGGAGAPGAGAAGGGDELAQRVEKSGGEKKPISMSDIHEERKANQGSTGIEKPAKQAVAGATGTGSLPVQDMLQKSLGL